MANPNIDNIREKIRRLLALSDSPNVHEAAAAAAKAQELMFKYNLEQHEIPSDQKQKPNYTKENYTVGNGRVIAWSRELLFPIAKYNFCKAFYLHNRDSKKRLHRIPEMMIIGEEHNKEIVRYLHAFIREEIIRLAEADWDLKGYGSKVSWKQAFCYGAVQGVADQLRAQFEKDRQAEVNTMALVVLKDKDLSEAVQRITGKVAKMKLGHNYSDYNAYFDGRRRGLDMEIRKGMSGGNKPSGYIE